jgi:hypothetical protein
MHRDLSGRFRVRVHKPVAKFLFRRAIGAAETECHRFLNTYDSGVVVFYVILPFSP